MEMPKPAAVDAGVRRLPRLDRMHTIGIAVLTILVLASQVLLQRGLTRELDDGPIINLAGRQRMLSQRIAKVAVLARQSTDPTTRNRLRGELAVALAEWTRAAEVLRESAGVARNTSVARSLAADLKSLEYAQTAMVSGVEQLLKLLADSETDALEGPVQQILLYEPTFLASMEAVVNDLERAAREHVQGLRTVPGAENVVIALLEPRSGAVPDAQAVHAGASLRMPADTSPDIIAAALGRLLRQSPQQTRVLVVDDDPTFGKLVLDVLGPRGIAARHITDPTQLLPMLEEHNPDLVLLDMLMPR
jgi:CheY-like chemotaxis protein